MNALDRFFWQLVPGLASRLSVTLGVALRDGDYLRKWPQAGSLGPPLGFVLGLLVSVQGVPWNDRPHPTFSGALLVMVILVAIAALGANLGFWAWLGFVVGDFVLLFPGRFNGSLVSTAGFGDDPLGWLRVVLAPLLISYALFFIQLVLVPLSGVAFTHPLRRFLKRFQQMPVWVLTAFLQVVVVGFLTFMWTQAAGTLVRVVWSARGESPSDPDIVPLQAQYPVIVIVVVIVTVVRVFLVRATSAQRPAPMRPIGKGVRLPTIVTAPLSAILTALLLAGLFPSPVDALIVILVLLGVALFREYVVPNIPVVPPLIRRIPLLIRLAVGVLFAGIVATYFINLAFSSGDQTLRSLEISVLISGMLVALLLPPEPREARAAEVPPAPPVGRPA
jgi:hypothetical protein